jgi:hypothetical protein
VEELATLFAGSADAADQRLSATAAACSSSDGAADPLQTLRALHYAIFAADAALRSALHGGSGSASNGAAAGGSPETSNGGALTAPETDARDPRELMLISHLEVLLTDAAAHVVAEVDRAREVGLLDGGTVAAAITLVGEEALWLGLCSQVQQMRRLRMFDTLQNELDADNGPDKRITRNNMDLLCILLANHSMLHVNMAHASRDGWFMTTGLEQPAQAVHQEVRKEGQKGSRQQSSGSFSVGIMRPTAAAT